MHLKKLDLLTEGMSLKEAMTVTRIVREVLCELSYEAFLRVIGGEDAVDLLQEMAEARDDVIERQRRQESVA